MKKRTFLLLLVLIAGGAGYLGFRLWPYLPERSRGAELAPADTIFFAQLPSLRRSALRWRGTDLYKIWEEPETQAFLEKPRRNSSQFRGWQQHWVLDPDALNVIVCQPGKEGKIVESAEELTGDDVLPDFRCRVVELFLLPGDKAKTSS